MFKSKTNLKPEELKEYFNNAIFAAENGLVFWNKRPGHKDQNRMLEHWQTVKDVLVKCKKDILGADDVALENPNSMSVAPCNFKEGTLEYLKHHQAEYERIKELADNAKGETANRLYQELHQVKLVLDTYIH